MDAQEIFNKKNIAQVTRAADRIGATGSQIQAHSTRTAVTAVVSLLVAQLFRLPESYWAPITTVVITQSSLGATLAVSWQRFIGTALGAAVGAILAAYFRPSVLVFAIGIFILGLLCALFLADRSAYRFGGVALAIVLLIPRAQPAWRIGFHRFAEVSIGIAVALLMTLVWPDTEAKPNRQPEQKLPISQ
jgi:uncharacterized membrane protein YgaE (UPF0421/DUF939 family)